MLVRYVERARWSVRLTFCAMQTLISIHNRKRGSRWDGRPIIVQLGIIINLFHIMFVMDDKGTNIILGAPVLYRSLKTLTIQLRNLAWWSCARNIIVVFIK